MQETAARPKWLLLTFNKKSSERRRRGIQSFPLCIRGSSNTSAGRTRRRVRLLFASAALLASCGHVQ